MYRLSIIILLTALIILPIMAQTNNNQVIAYVSGRGQEAEIYSMDEFGENVTQLTDNDAVDLGPSWSPDGMQIAYYSRPTEDDTYEIFIMNADGTNKRQITDNDWHDQFPSWSPDGEWLVFQSEEDGDSDIYIMDTNGENISQLTNNDVRDILPNWSPDGTTIAYASSNPEVEQVFAIYTVTEDLEAEEFGEPAQLLDTAQKIYMPRWSPDGETILYAARGNEAFNLYLVDADGENVRPLTEDEGIDYAGSWSPDGNTIVFHSSRDENLQIFTLNIDSGEISQLTSGDDDNYYPVWRPFND